MKKLKLAYKLGKDFIKRLPYKLHFRSHYFTKNERIDLLSEQVVNLGLQVNSLLDSLNTVNTAKAAKKKITNKKTKK